MAQFSSVQSLSRVPLFATPWTAARQASLSITNSCSLLKLMPIESVMPSNHLILYLLLGASMRNPAHGKGHEEETWQAKASRISREPPWTYSSIYPQTRICLPYYIMPFTNSSDINRGLSPHHLFLEKVNLELLDESPGHNKSVSIQKPLWWLSSPPARLLQLCMWLWPPDRERHRKLKPS